MSDSLRCPAKRAEIRPPLAIDRRGHADNERVRDGKIIGVGGEAHRRAAQRLSIRFAGAVMPGVQLGYAIWIDVEAQRPLKPFGEGERNGQADVTNT